jgi:2-methylisocitrate lyase-like PEP mutase family enzyme
MGYAIVILAVEPMFAAAKALGSMLRLVRRGARAKALREAMTPRADIEDLLGAPRYRALEDMYLPGAGDPGRGGGQK